MSPLSPPTNRTPSTAWPGCDRLLVAAPGWRWDARPCNNVLVGAIKGRAKPRGNPVPRYTATDWLTRAQTAEHLGVSIRMLQYLKAEGRLTPQKNEHTGRVRYRYLDVERLRVERATAWQADQLERDL